MHTHDHTGTSVCVHAVAVTDSHRRKGVASELLKEYIRRFQDDPAVGSVRVDRILLICHDDLIALYSRVGFTLAGKSPVVHGPNEWFEMRMEIGPSTHQEPPQAPDAVPPDVLAALTNPSRNRPSSRLFSSFASLQDLVSPSGENAFDILCPRPGCGSVILKAGVAKFKTGDSIQVCTQITLALDIASKLTHTEARAGQPSSTGATSTPAAPTDANRLVAGHAVSHGLREYLILPSRALLGIDDHGPTVKTISVR